MNDQEMAGWLRNLAFSMQSSVRLQQETFVAELLRQEKYQDPRRLARFEHQVYSQNGEDGVIQEVFRRIGTASKSFVEIGAGNGMENNTAFLLTQGWSGVWVEGSPADVHVIQRGFAPLLASGVLRLLPMIVTAENIEQALLAAGVPADIDLLCVDIDQNTYYAWRALRYLRPRAVVVEYNATFPPEVDWRVAYEPARMWDRSFHYGASLKAYEKLGADLGYALVGCELCGVNAFFVRQDLCGEKFVKPFDAPTHYEPPRYFLTRGNGHRRGNTFTAGTIPI